jgi:O-Antigen ligase
VKGMSPRADLSVVRFVVRVALLGIGFAGVVGCLAIIFSSSLRTLFLLALLGAIGYAFIIWRPYWGLLLLWAASFFQLPLVPYLLSALLLVPLGLAVLREQLRDRMMRLLYVPHVWILLTIGVLFIISIWWHDYVFPTDVLPEVDETWDQMRVFALRFLFLLFALYFVETGGHVNGLVWFVVGLILVTIVTALPGVSSVIPGMGPRGHWGTRAVASLSLADNPNRLGLIALFATSVLWFRRTDAPSGLLFRLVSVPFFIVLPYVALSTGSRSAFLQLVVLGLLMVKEQKGWSPAKRVRSLVFGGALAALLLSLVPATELVRATTFDPTVKNEGQDSLRNRFNTSLVIAKMVITNPILGVGIGDFVALKRALYGLPREQHEHNSYLWATLGGGVGALALYLWMIYLTFRMLKAVEASGVREWVWVVKALRTNLCLYLIASLTADIWLNLFFYLIVGLPAVMYLLVVRPTGSDPSMWVTRTMRPGTLSAVTGMTGRS